MRLIILIPKTYTIPTRNAINVLYDVLNEIQICTELLNGTGFNCGESQMDPNSGPALLSGQVPPGWSKPERCLDDA